MAEESNERKNGEAGKGGRRKGGHAARHSGAGGTPVNGKDSRRKAGGQGRPSGPAPGEKKAVRGTRDTPVTEGTPIDGGKNEKKAEERRAHVTASSMGTPMNRESVVSDTSGWAGARAGAKNAPSGMGTSPTGERPAMDAAGKQQPQMRQTPKQKAPKQQTQMRQAPKQQPTKQKTPRQQTPKQKPAGEDTAKKVPAAPVPAEPVAGAGKKGKSGGAPAVRVMFFGGVGEIGKNMTALECGDDIIVIDAGAIFPTEETPGIDLIVPDITYLTENASKVRALILTHGHEDHIGGVPYLLRELNVPVVGSRLSLALVDAKVREHRIPGVKTVTVKPGDRMKFGNFSVRFVNVTHSIAGAFALDIDTPQGKIFHSGDFKIDLTPVAGDPIDLKTISEIGESGVTLYLGESTNIERPGFTMSETTVGTTLDRLFGENASRRIIIATFASNVYRVQQIMDLAVKHKRVVALNGRSMESIVEAAGKIGEIHVPEGVLIDIADIKNYEDERLVIISTGTQGEAMSALTRMANGDNVSVKVGENDTIIISASQIPGNEKYVDKVINNLYRCGAEVVYEALEHVHVSGHACIEEHKIMHRLLHPKYFIPVHGEYRHLKKHCQLAESLGMKDRNVFIPDIGNCFVMRDGVVKRAGDIPSGSRLVDGEGIEDEKASVVVRDRLILSEDGLFVVSVAVSGGEVVGEPVINSRGFVFDFHRDYIAEMRDVIHKAIDGYDLSRGSVDELKRVLKKALRSYLWKKTRQSPMVVATVVEI